MIRENYAYKKWFWNSVSLRELLFHPAFFRVKSSPTQYFNLYSTKLCQSLATTGIQKPVRRECFVRMRTTKAVMVMPNPIRLHNGKLSEEPPLIFKSLWEVGGSSVGEPPKQLWYCPIRVHKENFRKNIAFPERHAMLTNRDLRKKRGRSL